MKFLGQPKKAIVTGVTGQDGSHLSDFLLSKGYHVVGVARRSSTSTTERINHLLGNSRFELVCGDITDPSSMYSLFANHTDVAEVYNLAAQSHVAVSFDQPAMTWDITGKGCLNILEAMRLHGSKARFYQAGSSEMFGKNYDKRVINATPYVVPNYGRIPIGNNQKEEIGYEKYQDENTKFMPQSPYAIAKCAAHYMTKLYREAYGIHASNGILFNHEGPRRGEHFVTRKITKWIGGFLKAAPRQAVHDLKSDPDYILFREPSTVHLSGIVISKYPKLRLGNLEAFRDWGFAGDYVEAMWMMTQQARPDDYVICTGQTHTIRDFLDVAFSYAGYPYWDKMVVVDPKFYRPAEVDYLRGDNSKARKMLGWAPKHSFEELVKLMVQNDAK